MQKFDRGERRYQTARLKKKRKNYWGYYGRSFDSIVQEGLTPRRLGKVVQYARICSCFMCSPTNYRRMCGNSVDVLTVQQRSDIEMLRKGLM